ncbi:MAG: alpha/beta hydrolase family esterase [Paracoccaceae bacterium]
MSTHFSRSMAKATELTRSGKLQEATDLIQSLLTKGEPDAAPTATEDAIEGSFTRFADPAPTKTSKPRTARAKPASTAARSGLSETLRKIAAGGMPARPPLASSPGEQPQGASFESLTHRSAHGTRDYRLYTPAKRSDQPMPLIVMLHGCTQSPEDFAKGTGMNGLAEEFGCLIAYPGQPSGANAQKCWNWFRPEDQSRDRGEPAVIAGITRDILRDHPVDPARVYIAGLSAGGAAAAIMGAAYPDLYAAIGVHSGLPAGGAQDIGSAFMAMRSGARGAAHGAAVPTIVFHGSADTTVHPQNGQSVLDRALEAHPTLIPKTVTGAVAGGRSYRQTRHNLANGTSLAEHWEIDGAGHAWSGGHAGGSYTDPTGPDASREMVRFFLQHRRA